MKATFIIPPVKAAGDKPAERTSGCTHVVYPTPNVYELGVAALIEQRCADVQVAYEDFVYSRRKWKDFERFVADDTSAVYYIWSVNLSLHVDTCAIETIHRLRPKAYVVLAGPGPTYFTSRSLVDERTIVVRGEPDVAMLEVTQAIAAGRDWRQVRGLSFIEGGVRKDNAPQPLLRDLDSLPFPARHFISHCHYHNPKLKASPYTTALTSRSCPHRCIYCVPSSLTFAREIEARRTLGRKPFVSFRSTASVDSELEQIASEGYRAVGFMDDNFIWDEERTAAICASLRKHGLLWGCQARVDAISEPIARLLGESGCRYIDLGVESFNDEILKFIKKDITSEQIYTAISLLKKHHVPVKLNILIGTSPLETKETLRDTLRRAKRLHVDSVMFNIVSPFPGTEFYDMAKANGWIATGDYVPTDVQRESILSYPHLSQKDMEQALRRSNLSYFLSPRFALSQLRKFRSIGELAHALRALKVKLFG